MQKCHNVEIYDCHNQLNIIKTLKSLRWGDALGPGRIILFLKLQSVDLGEIDQLADQEDSCLCNIDLNVHKE